MVTIAIPAERTENGDYRVADHFGRCPFFVVATIENNVVTWKEVFANPHYEQHMPFAVPEFLAGLEPKPDLIITSGLGPRAVDALQSHGIKVISGAVGDVETVIESYINGRLSTGKNICEHV